MSALLEKTAANLSRTATTLVFIDAGVEDPQFLANGVIDEAKAFILDTQRDGIEQITKILQDYPEVTSIHLVSHGSPGSIQLGNTYLSLDTLDRYQSDLKTWFNPPAFDTPLAKGGRGDLLIYGCNVAAGDAGSEWINKLHQITGADIAASKTKTGSSVLGGDWNLEVKRGHTEAHLIFEPNTLDSYGGVLGIVNDTEPNDTIATAQDLDGADWTLDLDPNIGDQTTNTSETIPHVTILGTGNDTFDYYKFTVDTANSKAIFDIDFGTQGNSIDSYLQLYEDSGSYLSGNDDYNTTVGQGGSTSGLDSYLEYTFTTPGIYVIEVGSYPAVPISSGGDYQLQISLENAPTNSAAEATNDTDAIDEDNVLTVAAPGVLDNDTGDGISVTASDNTSASGAAVTVNGNGGYSYDPTASATIQALDAGDILEDTFNYTITDSNNATADATVTVTVTGVNDAPEAIAIMADATNEDAANPYTIDLLSTASDVDDDAELSIANGYTATSSNGDRTVAFAIDETTGEFSLDPNQFNDLAADESETITVNYEVSDGTAMVDNTATFDVTGVNDAPMVETEIADQSTNDTDAFSIDLSGNFEDPDITDTLIFSASGLPAGLDINAAGMITGTATGAGVYNVTITAEDLSESMTDTFELTVQGVITGTADGDRLGANPQPNQIDGAGGNDRISGFASDDHLIGGEGDDSLKGGTENDLIEGGAGRDFLLGGKGMDTLSGGADNDLLKGGTQDDMLMGDAGLDRLYGNKGVDTFVLQADMGLDTIHDFKLGEDILQLEDGFTGTLGLTESGRNTMINIVDGEDETPIALLKGVRDVTLDSLNL